MRIRWESAPRRLRSLACLAFAMLLFPLQSAAQPQINVWIPAGERDRNRDDERSDWDDFNWTILQMQRESIAAGEEQAREAGRAKRRDEVEQSQGKTSAEREAYFESVLETSRAALRAPRGVYYRKPGYLSREAPGNGVRSITVGGVAYLYDQGIFWVQSGTQYIVVTAPFGAVVDSAPAGAARVPAGEESLLYFFGTFFRERGEGFEVVRPPAGTVVNYLPDGYRLEETKDGARYVFGEIVFQPVFIQGVLFFKVVDR